MSHSATFEQRLRGWRQLRYFLSPSPSLFGKLLLRELSEVVIPAGNRDPEQQKGLAWGC
jgi:hypothetical protein